MRQILEALSMYTIGFGNFNASWFSGFSEEEIAQCFEP